MFRPVGTDREIRASEASLVRLQKASLRCLRRDDVLVSVSERRSPQPRGGRCAGISPACLTLGVEVLVELGVSPNMGDRSVGLCWVDD